jgi:hypothetical protein
MSQSEAADNAVASGTKRVTSAYVPPLQRAEGQPPPIAANGGLSYMSFDQNGDAGTAVAIQDALTEIAEGEGRRVVDMIDKAPPGPIKTKWGLAFRDFDECVAYIRASNSLKAPAGGVTLPLQYTVCERPRWNACSSPRSRSFFWSSFPMQQTRWSTITMSSTRITRAIERKTRMRRTQV